MVIVPKIGNYQSSCGCNLVLTGGGVDKSLYTAKKEGSNRSLKWW